MAVAYLVSGGAPEWCGWLICWSRPGAVEVEGRLSGELRMVPLGGVSGTGVVPLSAARQFSEDVAITKGELTD